MHKSDQAVDTDNQAMILWTLTIRHNFGKRIGSKGWVHRALAGSLGTRPGLFGGNSGRTWLGPGRGWPWLPSGVRCTLNNRLRTGTDKGNLTV